MSPLNTDLAGNHIIGKAVIHARSLNDLPCTYTIGHAAGLDLIFKLTSERKYADLAKESFEWVWASATPKTATPG